MWWFLFFISLIFSAVFILSAIRLSAQRNNIFDAEKTPDGIAALPEQQTAVSNPKQRQAYDTG